MDRATNAPGQGKMLYSTDRFYLKDQMGLLSKLTGNATPNIGMLPSAPKEYSVNFQNIIYIFSLISSR